MCNLYSIPPSKVHVFELKKNGCGSIANASSNEAMALAVGDAAVRPLDAPHPRPAIFRHHPRQRFGRAAIVQGVCQTFLSVVKAGRDMPARANIPALRGGSKLAGWPRRGLLRAYRCPVARFVIVVARDSRPSRARAYRNTPWQEALRLHDLVQRAPALAMVNDIFPMRVRAVRSRARRQAARAANSRPGTGGHRERSGPMRPIAAGRRRCG